MNKTCICFTLLACIVISLAGCATKVSRVEKHIGNSFTFAKENQTANPEAGKNLKPVYGLGGPEVENIMKEYRKGFERPDEQQPIYLIGDAIGD